jgi:hypothetical protein
MLTNRTVTSREYKLMLRADRFRERKRGVKSFWRLVKFLAHDKLGGEIYKEQDEVLRRMTWYLDTPGAELRAHGFVLRIREEFGEKKRFKVTLKYRGSDRYVSASQDLSCCEDIEKKDNKFEEDILPRFTSKFSRSVAFKTDELPGLETMAQVSDLFSGLVRLNILPNAPVCVVNGFKAHEVVHRVGQLRFEHMPPGLEAKPDFIVKCCLSFWYLLGEDQEQPSEAGFSIDDEWPLTAEFSFDYDLPKGQQEDSDWLERFSPEVVAGTNLFFRSLQKQVGWLDRSGTTKTAYAFGAL